MKIQISSVSHKGLVRDHNEDMLSIGGLLVRDKRQDMTVDIGPESRFYLLVSDGMGGHEAGEVASRFVLERLRDAFSLGQVRPDNAEDDLRTLVGSLSSELNARAASLGQPRPMGCTLTGVVWIGGHTLLLNSGDSRTYRVRGGIMRPLTRDETSRGYTGDPSQSKLLLNCIGGGSHGRLVVEDITGRLFDDDIILVCSDGLTDMVPEEVIEALLGGELEPAPGATPAEDLASRALEAGGHDNISVIVARILGAWEGVGHGTTDRDDPDGRDSDQQSDPEEYQ